ncbi:MAG TPA: hypothetical protein VFH17_02540 [Coriobacteriia bacterium]|nr:hypothetical protein [Coriobacteriia bacterium]
MSDVNPVAPPAPPAPPPPAPSGAGQPDGTAKLFAALGYLFWPVAVVVLLIEPYKDAYYSRANAVQAIVLGVVWWIAWMIPIVGWVIGLVALVFAIIAIIRALNGEVYEVPVVYGIAKSFIDG